MHSRPDKDVRMFDISNDGCLCQLKSKLAKFESRHDTSGIGECTPEIFVTPVVDSLGVLRVGLWSAFSER